MYIIILILLLICYININSITHSKLLARPLITVFKYVYSIDTSDCLDHNYDTFNDFFTRRLNRPIGSDIISPADGQIVSFGNIINGTLLQVKGSSYSLKKLIKLKIPDVDYDYITFYLSPKDYHRVHLPYDAKFIGYKDINGSSLPVNMFALGNINGLYTKNIRSILVFNIQDHILLIVMIGATFINSIEHIINIGSYKKGDEIGKFNSGSTVILIYDRSLIKLSDYLGCNIRACQKIGELKIINSSIKE